jgi:hypothetical protein
VLVNNPLALSFRDGDLYSHGTLILFYSQAYEAARSERHNCRRGSAVVQLPASSVQMDLLVTTEEPLGKELPLAFPTFS